MQMNSRDCSKCQSITHRRSRRSGQGGMNESVFFSIVARVFSSATIKLSVCRPNLAVQLSYRTSFSKQASLLIRTYFSQWPFSCITNSGETARKARVLRLKRVEPAASRFVVVLMCVSPFVYSCYAFTGPKRGRPAPTITTPPFTRVRVRVFYPAMSGARFDGR